jgi:hypothetical protein
VQDGIAGVSAGAGNGPDGCSVPPGAGVGTSGVAVRSTSATLLRCQRPPRAVGTRRWFSSLDGAGARDAAGHDCVGSTLPVGEPKTFSSS